MSTCGASIDHDCGNHNDAHSSDVAIPYRKVSACCECVSVEKNDGVSLCAAGNGRGCFHHSSWHCYVHGWVRCSVHPRSASYGSFDGGRFFLV